MNRWLKTLGCVLLCAAMLLTAGCSEKEVSPDNRLFTYELSGEPASLDPQVATGEAALTVVRALYEGLCRVDSDGRAVPGAASGWETADNQTYMFTLRARLKWSDGSDLTAADFVYGIRRALEPKTRAPGASALFCIAGAEAYYNGEGEWDDVGVSAPNSRTLIVTLTAPDESFPAQTAQSVFMPCSESFFKSSGGQYGMEPDAILGNGPFALRKKSAWVHGEYIRLVRNKEYTGENPARPSGLYLKMPNGKEPVDPVAAVAAGTVHVAHISDEEVLRAEQSGLQVMSFAESAWGLAFNCANGPGAVESIRQALIAAIDRPTLMTYYPEEAANTVNLIPAAVTWHGRSYRRQAQNRVPYSTDEPCAQLLRAGLAELGRTSPPSLTILCLEDGVTRLLVNQLLTDWRTQLGWYVKVETVADEAALTARVASGDYQVALTGIRAAEDGAAAYLRQVAAYTGVSAPAPDDTIESLREAEDALLRSCVFYPMYARSSCYALGATVTDVVIQPFGAGIDFARAGRT